ncbi:hypothetical protein QBC40DRAFT_275433 [Triangularia verruculosa]|uniref:Secreted protein n=1 Tax=Triangularia verruculosa TaxID=2587418 RepID=A0AAN6XM05_9PEZI|nr:hypothetical protein QBC40DRAFT_275433 [Triangularia verruculosa]
MLILLLILVLMLVWALILNSEADDCHALPSTTLPGGLDTFAQWVQRFFLLSFSALLMVGESVRTASLCCPSITDGSASTKIPETAVA